MYHCHLYITNSLQEKYITFVLVNSNFNMIANWNSAENKKIHNFRDLLTYL